MSKVYTYVQERIINALEEAIKNGTSAPWIKPWKKGEEPKNFISKKMYRGINTLLLPYGGYYLSKKQFKDLQKKYDFLSLKEDATSHMVVFWTFKDQKSVNEDIESEENKNAKSVPIFKYYLVYHQSDISGFEKLLGEENVDVDGIEDIEVGIERYSKEVIVNYHSGNDAFYSPSKDMIMLPLKSQFKSKELYYSCLFHEMVHSTGNEKRLKRIEHDHFGDESYSKEELVAEIGASMLMSYYGIDNDITQENNIAYLKSWLSVLKDDIKLVTYAAQKAQKAVDYIINIMQPDSVSILEEKLSA